MNGWSLACPDWAERLRAGRSIIPDLPLDHAAANRAVAIFDRLRLPDVPGTPMLRDAAGEWFRDIVRAVFGSWDPVANYRYIQEVFALVGKKNAKTSYSAGLGITWLLLNERPNATGIIVAPTQDISEIAYSQAEGMVRLDPGLNGRRLRVQSHLKKITNTRTGAALEILTFDPAILTGQIPTFWLLDEEHVIARASKAAKAIGQIRGGMIAVPEAIGVIITTQSDDEPVGIFKADLRQARAIRDGVIKDSRTLPVLYEFPPDIARDPIQWKNAANWPMVMPNAGRSITIDRLRVGVGSLAEAEGKGEDEVRRWASQHLNIEIGVGLASDYWPGARAWEKNGDATLTLAAILDRAELVTIGIDGGGLDDLLGLAVIGRVHEDRDGKPVERWLVWTHAWAHRSVLDLRKQDAPKLLDLETAGDLSLVDDLADAYADLAEIVLGAYETGTLAKIGLDPAGVKLIVDEIRRALGLVDVGDQDEESRLIEGVTQGFRLQGTIKSVESKLDSFLITHCAQPLMAWAVGNARVKVSGNAILVTKQASGTGKIDPLMAVFDAADRMLAARSEVSVYTADRGLLMFG